MIANVKNKTMNKEFVPYEEALELKELGFDEGVYANYDIPIALRNNGARGKEYIRLLLGAVGPNSIKAPLYQQSFRWFRENYKLYHAIEFKHSKHYGYIQNSDFTIWCDTYEEAELACLKKLIEIIK